MNEVTLAARQEVMRILAAAPSEEVSADLDMLDRYLEQQNYVIGKGDSLPTIGGAQFGGEVDLPAMVHLVTAALLVVHAALEVKKSRSLESVSHAILSPEFIDSVRGHLYLQLISSDVPPDEATAISNELGRDKS